MGIPPRPHSQHLLFILIPGIHFLLASGISSLNSLSASTLLGTPLSLQAWQPFSFLATGIESLFSRRELVLCSLLAPHPALRNPTASSPRPITNSICICPFPTGSAPLLCALLGDQKPWPSIPPLMGMTSSSGQLARNVGRWNCTTE